MFPEHLKNDRQSPTKNIFHEQFINNVLCECFENTKDQITLNEHSINITGRIFVHNFQSSENVPC